MNTREKIVDIFLQNLDFTQNKIAKIVDVSSWTVNKAIQNYKLNISNETKPRSGRPACPADMKLERKGIARKNL
jgi:transposase